MRTLEIVLMGFYLCATAITWVFYRIFLDMISPAWIAQSTLLLVALMTAYAVWFKRLPRGTRRRWFKFVLLAGLIQGLALLAYAWRLGVDPARRTSIKNRGRGIWTAIVSGSMDREPFGLPPLWPRELGFTGRERSTDYFRRLMSGEAGEVTDDLQEALAPDLSPWSLGGPGLREATSARAFAAEHNAWQVVCVDSNTPDWVPFLISRNADFGDFLTPTSQVRLIRSGPLKLRSVAWVTCGGGSCYARFNIFRIGMMYPPEKIGQRTATTSLVYRIMRP